MIDMEALLEDMKHGLIIRVAEINANRNAPTFPICELINGAEELLLEMSHTNIKTGNGMSVFDYVQYYRKAGWTHIVYKNEYSYDFSMPDSYKMSMVRQSYKFPNRDIIGRFMDAKDVLEIYAYTGMKEELDTKDLSILFEV